MQTYCWINPTSIKIQYLLNSCVYWPANGNIIEMYAYLLKNFTDLALIAFMLFDLILWIQSHNHMSFFQTTWFVFVTHGLFFIAYFLLYLKFGFTLLLLFTLFHNVKCFLKKFINNQKKHNAFTKRFHYIKMLK